jgi:hypothetical protein
MKRSDDNMTRDRTGLKKKRGSVDWSRQREPRGMDVEFNSHRIGSE